MIKLQAIRHIHPQLEELWRSS